MLTNRLAMVPGTGFEPARLSALDPKSNASANSAIPAQSITVKLLFWC